MSSWAPGPSVAEAFAAASPRFRVICHFECGRGHADAIAAAEATWSLAGDLFGVAGHERGRPLDIHLYRDPARYRAARSSLLRPTPLRLAVTDPRSRSAHIALPEGIADSTLAAVGLPGSVLRVVAHEAFHLAALAHAPGSARLPAWLAEGAASWAEHEALRSIGRLGAAEEEPVASTYQWLMQRRLSAGELASTAAILADSLGDYDAQEEYAIRKIFFEYLRSSAFADALTEGTRAAASLAARRSLLGRLPPVAAVRAALDARLLGPDPESAAAVMDAGFHAHVAAAGPAWVQAGRALDPLGSDVWLQIGMGGGDAAAWRVRLAAGGLELAGRGRFIAGNAAQLLVGNSGDWHVTAEVDRAAGVMRVRRDSAGVRTDITEQPLYLDDDGGFEFLVSARRGGIMFVLSRHPPLHARIDALEPNGGWGLGATAGTAVLWTGVAVEPRNGGPAGAPAPLTPYLAPLSNDSGGHDR